MPFPFLLCLFFFNDTATTEIYTLSLHDALPISLESSMLTNMQWGAVAYLTESVYGTCTGTKGSAVCTAQPQLNSVSTYQTGCGPQPAATTSSGTTCNYYNTTIGKLASTNQKIYGVYDMNGGAME